MDVVVIDLAGGVDIDDTGDEDDDEDDEEDDDELELEASTPNSTTGKASVWPRVALGLLAGCVHCFQDYDKRFG